MSAAPLLAAAAGAWDTLMELTVSLELARISDGRAKRPYLAAWIEDQDRFRSARSRCGRKAPLAAELKAWFKDDRVVPWRKVPTSQRSVSSATAPAGKYIAEWMARTTRESW